MSDSYARVNIIVEGHTEETFVRDVLTEPLAAQHVFITARRVETGRSSRQIYRGGMTTYAKARRDIMRWLAQDRQAYVTTMFDLYRIPLDFPDVRLIPPGIEPYARITALEKALEADIGIERFIPYLQLHEFENLLFSDVQAIDTVLGLRRSQLQALQALREEFTSPELIDDGEDTAPSKRLQKLYEGYDKLAFGPRIATHIGLAKLRQECPHFNAWFSRLENLQFSNL